jgi:hypothetical protein
MSESYIEWHEDELEDMLNTPEGLVGEFLTELMMKMATVAKAGAPIQKPQNFSWGKKYSTSYMPWSGGYTKAHTVPHMGYTKGGHLFGGVNAPYGPTLFLEKPARQLKHSYPFMTTALYSLSI